MATLAIVPPAPQTAPFSFTEAEIRERASAQGIDPEQAIRVARAEGLIPSRMSLYEIEDHLQALVECEESVDPELEEQFRLDLTAAMTAAAEKRDRVGHFMAHLDSLIAFAQAEQKRLQKRERFYQGKLDHIEENIVRIIEGQGTDAKGKYKKLEGNACTFSVKRNPPSTIITDEPAVPTRFKTVTITLPAELWESLVDSLDPEFAGRVLDAVKRPDSTVSKPLVKSAIEDAVPGWKDLLKEQPSVYTNAVPGAAIAAGGLKLVRS